MDSFKIILSRNGIDESFHNIELVDNKSNKGFDYFPRSAIKPFQLLPLVAEIKKRELEIDYSEIAIFCASHSGELIHTDKVEQTAKKYSLNYEDIFCERQIPFNADSYKNLVENKNPFTKLHNNCSGKHIGMLLLCQLLDFDINGYENLQHPLQQIINKFYEELFELDNIFYGVDGCGLPAPYLNSLNFINSVSKLNEWDAYRDSWMDVFNSFIAFPKLTAGTGRVDTILMEKSDQDLLIKAGAEGSMFFTDLTNSTVLKCVDGSKRGVEVASMYYSLTQGFIDESVYEEFTYGLTHNNQNTKVADIKIV